MAKKDRILLERLFKIIKKNSATSWDTEFLIIKYLVYINLLIIKPFFLMKEKETDEYDEETKFTVSLITALFGRYDNESPPLLMFP